MAVKLLKGIKKFLDVDNESEYLDELKAWARYICNLLEIVMLYF